MHVLNRMGKPQYWVTSLHPSYLNDKYGENDKGWTREPDVWKPVRTKWPLVLVIETH